MLRLVQIVLFFHETKLINTLILLVSQTLCGKYLPLKLLNLSNFSFILLTFLIFVNLTLG